MGTRALVHLKDGEKSSDTLVTIYRQFDGYPEGLGLELLKILGDGRIINGISYGQTVPKFFNGMGCLAAYLVGVLKEGEIGSLYLYPPDSKGCGEEYTYTIWREGELLYMECMSTHKEGSPVYSGQLHEFKFEPEDS